MLHFQPRILSFFLGSVASQNKRELISTRRNGTIYIQLQPWKDTRESLRFFQECLLLRFVGRKNDGTFVQILPEWIEQV